MKLLRYSAAEYDLAIINFINTVLHGFHSLHPVFGPMFKETTVHAGPVRNIAGPNPLDQETLPVRGIGDLHKDAVTHTDIEAFTQFLYDLAQDVLHQLSAQFYRGLDEITNATGMKVDAKGKPLSADIYLDMLEKMSMSFTENGDPILPTLIVGEEFDVSKLDANEDQLRRFEAIITAKKAELNAQKRTRRLY